jgi:hypothetical protein
MRKILVFFAVILALALAACGAAGTSASPVHKATLTGVYTGPSAPAGWKVTYARNFATTPGLGDWVVCPDCGGAHKTNADVIDSTHPGAEFGVGIKVTAESQWAEIRSTKAVVGPSAFVQALVFIPQTSNGETANWPAWWTANSAAWPRDGEIDALEGLGGHSSFHTHYGATAATEINSPNFNAVPNTIGTNWVTISFLRENGQVTAWYGTHKLGTVPLPTNGDEQLTFQNQSFSTSVCASCFGPFLPATAWLSRTTVYAPA